MTDDETPPLSSWLKIAEFSPLAELVVAKGICAKCHTKTLEERHRAEGYVFSQCRTCKTIFAESKPDLYTNPGSSSSR